MAIYLMVASKRFGKSYMGIVSKQREICENISGSFASAARLKA